MGDGARRAGERTADRRLAVLGYHKIGRPSPGGWDTWFYVPEAVFAAQLRCLAEGGWEVVGAGDVLRGLEDPNALPRRAALLTFDDGYRSVLEVAAPHLRRLGLPAVLFVPTDSIGDTNLFDEGAEPTEAICDWADLRALLEMGVSVQSHGVTHRPVSDLSPSELEHELSGSKSRLESGLGSPVELFAYPYGDAGPEPSATAAALERAGYRAACLYEGGATALPITNPYGLARVPMGRDTDLQVVLA